MTGYRRLPYLTSMPTCRRFLSSVQGSQAAAAHLRNVSGISAKRQAAQGVQPGPCSPQPGQIMCAATARLRCRMLQLLCMARRAHLGVADNELGVGLGGLDRQQLLQARRPAPRRTIKLQAQPAVPLTCGRSTLGRVSLHEAAVHAAKAATRAHPCTAQAGTLRSASGSRACRQHTLTTVHAPGAPGSTHLYQVARAPGTCRAGCSALRRAGGKMGSTEGRCQVAAPPAPCLSCELLSTQCAGSLLLPSAAAPSLAPQSHARPVLGHICGGGVVGAYAGGGCAGGAGAVVPCMHERAVALGAVQLAEHAGPGQQGRCGWLVWCASRRHSRPAALAHGGNPG